jgi:hypothetical protein
MKTNGLLMFLVACVVGCSVTHEDNIEPTPHKLVSEECLSINDCEQHLMINDLTEFVPGTGYFTFDSQTNTCDLLSWNGVYRHNAPCGDSIIPNAVTYNYDQWKCGHRWTMCTAQNNGGSGGVGGVDDGVAGTTGGTTAGSGGTAGTAGAVGEMGGTTGSSGASGSSGESSSAGTAGTAGAGGTAGVGSTAGSTSIVGEFVGVRKANYPGDRNSAWSIWFDDNRNIPLSVRQMLDAADVRISLALVAARVDSPINYLAHDIITDMARNGHEIASHTYTHSTVIDSYQVEGSKSRLEWWVDQWWVAGSYSENQPDIVSYVYGGGTDSTPEDDAYVESIYPAGISRLGNLWSSGVLTIGDGDSDPNIAFDEVLAGERCNVWYCLPIHWGNWYIHDVTSFEDALTTHLDYVNSDPMYRENVWVVPGGTAGLYRKVRNATTLTLTVGINQVVLVGQNSLTESSFDNIELDYVLDFDDTAPLVNAEWESGTAVYSVSVGNRVIITAVPSTEAIIVTW